MAKKKLMIHDFYQMKQEGRRITWLTSYDEEIRKASLGSATGLTAMSRLPNELLI